MANRPLVVGIDVDEVCADLLGEWLHRYNKDFNDTKLVEDILGWDLTTQTKAGANFYKYLNTDIYADVRPIVGARRTVDAIRAAGHRVVFVTSCARGSVEDKFDWLRRYGFLPHAKDGDARFDFFPVKDKSLIRCDVLFDDAPHNVEGFPSAAYLVQHPHNREYTGRWPRVDFTDTDLMVDLLNRLAKLGPL